MTAEDVDDSIRGGFERVENYLDDPRGRSCLILTWIKGMPVHVVCAPHEDTLIVITVYTPTVEEWGEDFKIRRKPK